MLSDGQTAVAADPDRDRVYVVDLSARTVTATVMLARRATNRAASSRTPPAASHVALRHGGADRQLRSAPGATVRHAARGLRVAARPRVRRDRRSGARRVRRRRAGQPARRRAAPRSARCSCDRDLRDVVVDGSRAAGHPLPQRGAADRRGRRDGVEARSSLPAFTTPRGAQRAAVHAPARPGRWCPPRRRRRGASPARRRRSDPARPRRLRRRQSVRRDRSSRRSPRSRPTEPSRPGPALPGLVLAVDMAISPDGGQGRVRVAGQRDAISR